MHQLKDVERGLSVDSVTTHATQQSQMHLLETKHGKVIPGACGPALAQGCTGPRPRATCPPTSSNL